MHSAIMTMFGVSLVAILFACQSVQCGGSTTYFNDDIVPCDDLTHHHQTQPRENDDDRQESLRRFCVDEEDANACQQLLDQSAEQGGLAYGSQNIYAKLANKNTIKQHDRFNGAAGPNIYKKYFKKDMRQSSRGNANVGPKLALIVDTDIGQFPDDPAAMAVVHGLVDLGNAQLLATVGSTKYEGVVRDIDVINQFFDRPNTPIGVTKDAKAHADPANSQPWTQFLRERYSAKVNWNCDAEDALAVYRRTLANAADGSVTILAIGHFINLANLMETPPDTISKLSGRSLVKKKVREVIAMAGTFPHGREWNIEMDAESARKFAANWPSKVTYVGFEVGNVTCGTKYQGLNLSQTNPIASSTYFGYQKYHGYNGCFDAVAALIAGRETSKLYCAVYGQIRISPDGSNDWIYSSKSKVYHQRFLKMRGDPDRVTAAVSKRINDFLPDIV